jgi:predicted dienelactone hydrolase
MRSTLRLVLSILTLPVLAAGLLGACSSDESSTDTAAATTTVVPIPSGPPPYEPGPYQVGRRTITVTDPARDGRELTVDVWYPADAATAASAPKAVYAFIPGVEFTSEVAAADVPIEGSGPFPFVVYSHGSGGLRYNFSSFTELLASYGVVVASPDHAGNTALDAFLGTSASSDENQVNRPTDVAFLISELLAAESPDTAPFAGALDADRIGVVGHSAGGFTALASVAGHAGVPPDARVRAIVGMAPFSRPLSDEELQSIDVPTMLLSATKDTTTPIADDTERPWELISGRPLYRVDLVDAGHESFADICAYQELAAQRPDWPAPLVETIDQFAEEACTPGFLDIEVAHRDIATFSIPFLLEFVAGDDSMAGYLTPAFADTLPEVEFQVKETEGES